jgi:hypothetical protein
VKLFHYFRGSATVKVHDLAHSKATIQVYGREHAPPHFHIVGPGWAVSVNVATLNIDGVRGAPPKAAIDDALTWAAEPRNKAKILEKWDLQNERVH